MIKVLILAGLLYGLGALLNVSRAARLGLVAILLAAVLGLQVILPDGHGLRVATGGSAKAWAVLLGMALVVGLYAQGVSWLKRRAPQLTPEIPQATAQGPFSEAELERYARHIVLHEIGGPGQQKLKAARVLIIGAGGLGSPVLLYLAAAGVGTLGVVDDDTVSLSNLQRQVLHDVASIGKAKVDSARARLSAINPHVLVRPHNMRLGGDNAAGLFAGYDLVIDGSDNFATRHIVNEAAVAAGKPLISGAISQWEGQVALFHSAGGGPCYACVFPEVPAAGLVPTCAEVGVMGALPGVIGAIMATEAIKWIAGAGTPLTGSMLVYDALYTETRRLTVERRAGCRVCGGA